VGRKTVRWIVAVVALVLAGFVAVPGCKLKLCKGDGCGGGPDVGGWGGAGATGGGGGAGGSFQQSPEEVLAQLDPTELAAGTAKAGYAAYMLSGLVSQKVAALPDPASVDSATMHQFIEESEPDAWAAAEAWITTIDLQSLPGLVPNDTCTKPPQSCASTYHDCAFAHICLVVDCGLGKCGLCPDIFELPPFVFDQWCVFTCIVGDPYVITGWAISFHITALDEWVTWCHANH